MSNSFLYVKIPISKPLVIVIIWPSPMAPLRVAPGNLSVCLSVTCLRFSWSRKTV